MQSLPIDPVFSTWFSLNEKIKNLQAEFFFLQAQIWFFLWFLFLKLIQFSRYTEGKLHYRTAKM